MKLKLILITASRIWLLAACSLWPAQAAPFAYVTNRPPNEVSQTDRRAPDGLLAPFSPATVPRRHAPIRAAVSPDGRSVYVADISATVNGFISQYGIGPGGTLSPKSPAAVAARRLPVRAGGKPGRPKRVCSRQRQCQLASPSTTSARAARSHQDPCHGGRRRMAQGGVAVSPNGRSVYVTSSYQNDERADLPVRHRPGRAALTQEPGQGDHRRRPDLGRR